MKKIFNWKIGLILIIILASFLRLWKLGQVPISMADDEIREAVNGYSIAHTGRDVFGNFMPLAFNMEGSGTYGQIPIYISSIFLSFMDLNSFTARLPFALAGIISVLFLCLILRKTFNNEVALLSAFALSVSVWNLQISRFVLEADIALMFYLVGIFLFLNSIKKKYLFSLSMIFFFLAFYSYAATKIIFLPILLLLSWYKFKDLTKKHLLIIAVTILFSFTSFWYLSVTQGASSYSGNQFFFQDKQNTALNVELERRASVEPSIVKFLYKNKFTYWGKIFVTNYLFAFSPQYLFLDQESNGIYSIWGRGELYMFELPLLVIGLLYFFLKRRREFYLFLGLLLISPLPSALGFGTPTWMARSGLENFWLSVLIGAGICGSLNMFKKIKYRYLVICIILILYLYSLIGYLSQYYYDWSRTNAKYFSKSTQDLVHTMGKYKTENKIIVSGATINVFLHYAFYNKIGPIIVQKALKNNPIRFENILFQSACINNGLGDPKEKMSQKTVYISPVSCHKETKPDSIIRAYDNTEDIWKIYIK